MTIPPIVPFSSGLEIVVYKDGNPWSICTTANAQNCDGELGSLVNGQVVGIPSKEPYFYSSVEIPHGDRLELNGFTVGVRYYEQTSTTVTPPGTNPDTGLPYPPNTTYSRTYPGFYLHSQTYVRTGRQVFETDTGAELFTATPGDRGVGEFGEAGITDGTAYTYGLVFDQARIEYMPRLSRAGQSLCDGIIPTKPYDKDANPPVFPIDYLVAFLPDPRDSVTVGYQLTTVWGEDENSTPLTTTVVINHTCTQPENFDFAGVLDKYTELSYYGNGYEHLGLYPITGQGDFDLPNYDRNGNLVSGVLNEPVSVKQLTRQSYPWNPKTKQFKPYPE